MKVLPVLSLAVAASALPIHANLKVVKVDSEGNAEVQRFDDVDLDKYESLEALASAIQANELKADDVQNVQIGHIDAQEDISIAKAEDEAASFRNFVQATYDRFNELLATVHEVKATPDPQYRSISHESSSRVGHRPHGVKPHGVKPHCGRARKAHAKKIQQAKQQEVSGMASNIEYIKQYGQDLYSDVRNIDFQDSFNSISQDLSAICAIVAGFALGSVIVTMIIIAALIKRSRGKTFNNKGVEGSQTEIVNEKGYMVDEEEALPLYEEYSDEDESYPAEKQ